MFLSKLLNKDIVSVISKFCVDYTPLEDCIRDYGSTIDIVVNHVEFMFRHGRRNALYYAYLYGHIELVKYIVENFDTVRKRCAAGIVTIVAEKGDLEMLKYLVSHGAQLREKGNAIRMAAEKGYLEVVQYLVSQGANPILQDDYAMRYAAKNGHLETVQYLVSQGADIHSCDEHALRMAAENGHIHVVKYLMARGANPIVQYSTTINKATENGHFEIVKYLDYSRDERTLDIALENNHTEIVKYLISKDIEKLRSDKNRINLIFIRAAGRGNLDLIEYLITIGFNIICILYEMLSKAAYHGHINTVKYLVARGANPDTIVLCNAISSKNFETVEYIVSVIKKQKKACRYVLQQYNRLWWHHQDRSEIQHIMSYVEKFT